MVIKLTPYLERDGHMCVGRWLGNAPLLKGNQHPIILPQSEGVAEVTFFKLHRDRDHLKACQLHQEACQQYWIRKVA